MNIDQLSQAISRLPPAEIADFLESMGANILSQANQCMMQNICNGGSLTACSKHLEQASREILRFAEYRQIDEQKEQIMKNKCPVCDGEYEP